MRALLNAKGATIAKGQRDRAVLSQYATGPRTRLNSTAPSLRRTKSSSPSSPPRPSR